MTTSKTLVTLKMNVVAEFQDFPYIQKQIARDECYSSNNSMEFKRRQLADRIAEFASAVDEGNDYRASRAADLIDSMEAELEALQARFDADLQVYAAFHDGEEWVPQSKKPRQQATLSSDKKAQLAKRVAAAEKKAGLLQK